MKPYMEEHEVNLLGEFKDGKLEREFMDLEYQSALRFLRPIALTLGIMNTLFLIPDYFFINNADNLPGILVIRLAFLFLIILFFGWIHRVRSPIAITNIISLIEATFIITFLYIMYQYEKPDFMIQSIGVITFITVVFMVPNRWINMNLISLTVYLGFAIMSILYKEDIKGSHLSASLVYIPIIWILISISTYRTLYYKRTQYVHHNELMRVATMDPLTKAYNRVKLDEEMENQLSHSKERRKPLSIIMFDFDDFKGINDRYGHVYGDYIIVKSVELIRGSIRDSDILARWGGDEFILLLPNTNEKQAIELAWRISDILAGHRFEKKVTVTCSFGVAEMLPEDDISSFLGRADQMLYISKKAGKSRVNGQERGEQDCI